MGADCANKITFRKSITQLLNKSNCQGGEMGLVCGYVWHQIRFEFYVKWSAWAWPAMGRIFGLEGVEKKERKKDRKPWRATAGHLALLLYLLLLATWPLSLLGMCVRACMCLSAYEFASASCPCCLSLPAPLEAADAISWQYCGSPCCE